LIRADKLRVHSGLLSTMDVMQVELRRKKGNLLENAFKSRVKHRGLQGGKDSRHIPARRAWLHYGLDGLLLYRVGSHHTGRACGLSNPTAQSCFVGGLGIAPACCIRASDGAGGVFCSSVFGLQPRTISAIPTAHSSQETLRMYFIAPPSNGAAAQCKDAGCV